MCRSGFKVDNFLNLVEKFPDLLNKYEYILFVDDDIEITAETAALLLKRTRKLDVSLSQPTHIAASFKPEYPFLFSRRGLSYQFVSFIEIQCFCIKTSFLRSTIPQLSIFSSGYGLDLYFSNLLKDQDDQIVLFHDLTICHPYREESATVRGLIPRFDDQAAAITHKITAWHNIKLEDFFSNSSFKVHRSVDANGNLVSAPEPKKKFKKLLAGTFRIILKAYEDRGAKVFILKRVPLYIKWRLNQHPGLHSRFLKHPLIPFEAKRFLDKTLKPNMSVFEFGSGWTTHYLLKKVASVVTIEHNKDFFSVTQQRIGKGKNIKMQLIPPDPVFNSAYASGDQQHLDMSFEAYVRSIDDYSDESFDMILVDGRCRVACVKQALPKVKPGGMVFLDDSNRPRYKDIEALVPNNWKRTEIFGAGPLSEFGLLKQVTIFQRPNR